VGLSDVQQLLRHRDLSTLSDYSTNRVEELVGQLQGIVRLVIGAAEVDDLGVDPPEGDQLGEVLYQGRRYPAEIIAHCVWLYHRFPLSFGEVEEALST
jgi:hypothetical protein